MSQFLLAFDKETVFNSFFVKVKSVTEYPTVTELKDKEPTTYKLFLDIFNVDETDLDKLEEIYQERAIFRAEFAKVASICFGYFNIDENQGIVQKEIKSIMKEDEIDTIRIFWQVLDKLYRSNKDKILVGHYLNTFDVPFYIKRLFKHKDKLSIEDKQGKEYRIGIPDILKKMLVSKPWEQVVVDTSEIFKFGGKSKPSIDQIAHSVGYVRDDKEIRNDSINSHYWSHNGTESAMKDIALVGNSDVEIMMDFLTELRTV